VCILRSCEFFFLFFSPFLSQLSFLFVLLKNSILELCCTTVSAFFSTPRCFRLCLLPDENFRGRRFEHFFCIEIGDGSS
jgi:hypothetical protein